MSNEETHSSVFLVTHCSSLPPAMKPTKTTYPSLLDEPIALALLIGAALLIGGVYLVNR